MSVPSLARVRREIAETDRQILQGVARRLRLARKVGRIKRDHGLPLRDYLVEREVIHRWVVGLGASDVPADRVLALVQWLMEEATYAQESLGEPGRPPEEASDVVVVGGLGQMGGWMRDFLRTAGLHVGVVDRRRPRGKVPFPIETDLARGVRDVDVVVLATPMRATPRVYEHLLATKTDATIFDILSIKAPILPSIRSAVRRGFSVTSAHPLFGPGARSLFGRNMLVLDCGNAPATRRVAALFRPTALRVSVLPIEHHDALMADVLGLPHVLSLLFARTLQQSRRSAEELGAGGTTSFRRISDVAQIVTRENPELVGDIQTLNPASAELFERLAEALKDLESAVRQRDPGGYESMLHEGRTYLERFTAARGKNPN